MTIFHAPAIGSNGDIACPVVGAEVSQEFLDRIPGGIFRYCADDEGRLDFVNRGLLEMFGCQTYEEFMAFTHGSFWGMVHPGDQERVRAACDPAVVQKDRVRYRIVRKDGRVRWVDDHGQHVVDSGGNSWFYVTLLDVTEMVELQDQLNQAAEQLEAIAMLDTFQQRAEEDELTRVLNRSGVKRHINELLAEANGRPCTFFIMDIDDFKYINDTFGHPEGDEVLRSLARHLRNTVRRDDVVGRMGGDEFVVFCMGLGEGPARESLASRLRQWSQDMQERECPYEAPTLSMGVASSPDSSLALHELYSQADAALYRAKDSGKNQVCFSAEKDELIN